MNIRQKALYNYLLSRSGEWTTHAEIARELYEHYGNDLEINRTIEENGINYFAVYKDGEKYASVSVDLVTGKATETITATGDKTQFSLI